MLIANHGLAQFQSGWTPNGESERAELASVLASGAFKRPPKALTTAFLRLW